MSDLLKRFAGYYSPHRGLFALDFTSAVAAGLLELAFPVAVTLFIDRLLPTGQLDVIALAAIGLFLIYLFNAGNLGPDGQINWAESAIRYRKGDALWHTDSSFMDLRTSYSMLRAVEVPASGGPTCFADARSAYDDLPQDVKDRIDGLECEHSLWWSRKQAGADITCEQIEERL